MKILIDIPEEKYKTIQEGMYCGMLDADLYRDIKNGIPLDDLRAMIIEEKECAYADFDKYKVDYLGVDSRYVEDELPDDDFRYGMERCIEIIDKYRNEVANEMS